MPDVAASSLRRETSPVVVILEWSGMASPLRGPRDFRSVEWVRANGSGFAIENKLAHGEAMMPIETIRSRDALSGERAVLRRVSSRRRVWTVIGLQEELIDAGCAAAR
jgi:hypothetical protein